MGGGGDRQETDEGKPVDGTRVPGQERVGEQVQMVSLRRGSVHKNWRTGGVGAGEHSRKLERGGAHRVSQHMQAGGFSKTDKGR